MALQFSMSLADHFIMCISLSIHKDIIHHVVMMVIENTTNSHFCTRIGTLSKLFPTLMLYKLWEDGKVSSLDDPLEKYVKNFTIKNPLAKAFTKHRKQQSLSSITLRRMASHLSGTKI